MPVTKSVAVMKYLPSAERNRPATYVMTDDDTGRVTRTVVLDDEDRLAFGSPKQITVTVEPGDLLNHTQECRDGSFCGEPSACPPADDEAVGRMTQPSGSPEPCDWAAGECHCSLSSFVHFDGRAWPSPLDPNDVQHTLRYGQATREQAVVAASFMAAYRELVWMPESRRREIIRALRTHANASSDADEVCDFRPGSAELENAERRLPCLGCDCCEAESCEAFLCMDCPCHQRANASYEERR